MFNAVKKMGGYAAPFQTGEWFAVNADGSKPRPLIFYGTRDVTQRGKKVGNERFTLLDTLKGDDRNVLMQARYTRSSEGAGTEVVRMDPVGSEERRVGKECVRPCEYRGCS